MKIYINKDIGSYKPRLVGFMNKRQVICCCIALPFCLFFYLGTSSFLSRDIAGFLAFVPAILAGLFGWVQPYGIPMELFLKSVFIGTVLAPANRVYRTVNRHEKAFAVLEAADNPVKQRKQKYKASREAVR